MKAKAKTVANVGAKKILIKEWTNRRVKCAKECVCGAELVGREARLCYDGSATYCNMCEQTINPHEISLTCPNKHMEEYHPHGWDVCVKCAEHNAFAVRNPTEDELDRYWQATQTVLERCRLLLCMNESNPDEAQKDSKARMAQLAPKPEPSPEP